MVGQIIELTVDTNPATLWIGTTWEKIESKFLLGAGSSYNLGATGGNADISLGINNMPKHRHKVDSASASIPAHGHKIKRSQWNGDAWNNPALQADTWGSGGYVNSESAGGGTTGSFAPYTDYQGSGSAFSIMPPYLAVNIWKRTS